MARSLDPRLPVLVGAGQLSHRGTDLDVAPEPAALMVAALRTAEADSAGSGLLAAVDSVRTVGQLSWPYPNVADLVAGRIGATPRQLIQSRMGGNLAGAMVIDAARAIQAGDLDVAVVCGAESWRTRNRARAAGVTLPWTTQRDDLDPPELFGPSTPLSSDVERERGVVDATHIYALFEAALRARQGLGIHEHRRRIGGLWSAYSAVAAENPHAWSPQFLTPEAIWEATPDNRMIAFPYTKRLCSNNSVDQGAAVILTSVATAERHGVSQDRWVFLHAGAEANDHWFMSERADLCSSPAVRLAGRELFALGGTAPDELTHVDLYSCFPSAVQIAAEELGLIPRAGGNATGWGGVGASVPLTVTGGMNFAGGPWNNFPTHGLATMAGVLRSDPGTTGLCTANGGWTTEHALMLLSTEPPTSGTFRTSTPQAAVDALPAVEVDDAWVGRVTIESATVVYDREGPDRAIVAGRTPAGRRTWCTGRDPDLMAAIESQELAGASAMRTAAAELRLDSIG